MKIEEGVRLKNKERPSSREERSTIQSFHANPYLHVEQNRIVDPLTDRTLKASERGFAELTRIYNDPLTITEVSASETEFLREEGWLVEKDVDLSDRFYLKYVSLEAHSLCNQSCTFCPVSTHRREPHFMSTEFYEEIVVQLAEYRETIDGVSMVQYNEPTVDRRFLDQIGLLKRYGLSPGVVTNGSGMTPKRVDAIMEMGGLRYFSVNFSTMDSDRYRAQRGVDQANLVVENLDHIKDLELAPIMDIAVLGSGDAAHRRDFEEITRRYAGSRFEVKYYETMDRAGNVPFGLRPDTSNAKLCGCEQTGSRPIQWVHITSRGKCVLCCQDYHEKWVVGDLEKQSLKEILSGEPMARYRRWLYNVEEAPADFICRHCIYARTR
jgi:wyosine [tRNA(Phe)-imidazoG37] synthetase (radical SAM superfamily)